MKLGSKIRLLRTERGITQEALAQVLGVTFTSVSKWETETTTPDIGLLPDIAKFFGVTLDDLFSLTTDDYISRIDTMLQDDFIITHENFIWAERYLKGIMTENSRDSEARVRLIELHRHRAGRDLMVARRYAQEGIRADDDDERFHRMFFSVCKERGDLDLLIKYYENEVKSPNIHAIRIMIEAYLETKQPDKAKAWVYKLEKGVEHILYEGDILLTNGSVSAAKEKWISAEPFAATYQEYLHIAERFDKIRDYDRAIEFYQKASICRPSKGALDHAYALAFIYDNQGNVQEAIAMWETILEVLKSDWGITSGATADWPRREIERLRAV